MPAYSFILTEYEPDRPWLIVATGRDSVELPEGEDFERWARARYPSDRYRVQLDREPFRWGTAHRE